MIRVVCPTFLLEKRGSFSELIDWMERERKLGSNCGLASCRAGSIPAILDALLLLWEVGLFLGVTTQAACPVFLLFCDLKRTGISPAGHLPAIMNEI